MLKIVIILCFTIVSIQCPDPCGDWTQYKDKKCFKVLQRKASYAEAVKQCVGMSEDSTLVTIYDIEEQQFINKLLEPIDNISPYAWMGMKFNGQEYDWMDGTDSHYTNWPEEGVNNNPCVQMSLSKRTLGMWSDCSCKRQALVVCQRKQTFSLSLNSNSMKDIIEDIIKTIDYQKIEFKRKTEGFQNAINSLAEDMEKQKLLSHTLIQDIQIIKTKINGNKHGHSNPYNHHQVRRQCSGFDCGNHRCIERHLLCNGVDNCGNGADEDDCKHSQHSQHSQSITVPQHCPHNKFYCYDTDNTCVANNAVCDGYSDCPNNHDEKTCRRNRY